jgi:hypothetical protein
MKTLFGAVAGALALGAVLVAYDLGEHHTFNRDVAAMAAGYQPGQPYALPMGETGFASPYAPYGAPYAAQYHYGMAGPMAGYAVPQYVNQPAAAQPVVQRASTQRSYVTESARTPARTWQKSAMLIGGSAAGAAGVGALIAGNKGAGIGALIGGGAATLYDQMKRR